MNLTLRSPEVPVPSPMPLPSGGRRPFKARFNCGPRQSSRVKVAGRATRPAPGVSRAADQHQHKHQPLPAPGFLPNELAPARLSSEPESDAPRHGPYALRRERAARPAPGVSRGADQHQHKHQPLPVPGFLLTKLARVGPRRDPGAPRHYLHASRRERPARLAPGVSRGVHQNQRRVASARGLNKLAPARLRQLERDPV